MADAEHLRFKPTDEEIIRQHLNAKALGVYAAGLFIHEVEFYNHTPDTLSARYAGFEGIWYFLTTRTHKMTPRDVAVYGRWFSTKRQKLTALYPDIQEEPNEIGSKHDFIYHDVTNKRTEWRLSEYTTKCTGFERTDWMICKLYRVRVQRRRGVEEAAGEENQPLLEAAGAGDEEENERPRTRRRIGDASSSREVPPAQAQVPMSAPQPMAIPVPTSDPQEDDWLPVNEWTLPEPPEDLDGIFDQQP